jgi:hypothetical protein
MYAAVTTVFDVSSLLQSWKWRVEAYAAAECRYSMVMVGINLQLHSSLALFLSSNEATSDQRSLLLSILIHIFTPF